MRYHSEDSVRKMHELFNELSRKAKTKVEYLDRHYPPITDYRSAYQNGLLDAVVGGGEFLSELHTAPDSVIREHYHEGYKEGEFLLFEEEQE